MLDDVVAALRAGGIADVRILAADDAAAAAAAERGLAALRDTGPGGDLRAAVDAGLAAVGPDRPRLVVAADLPGLSAADVAALRAAAVRTGRVTLLPTPDGGTAVLVLPAAVTVPARYGPDSAALHAEAARAAGYEVEVLEVGAGARDVDGPVDLDGVLDAVPSPAVGAATAATLAAIAARRRT